MMTLNSVSIRTPIVTKASIFLYLASSGETKP